MFVCRLQWVKFAMAFNVGIYEDIKYCFYPAEKMSIPPIQWNRADSRFAPSQWEVALQSNDVSHWLGASLESALNVMRQHYGSKHTFWVHFLHNGCCFTLFFFIISHYHCHLPTYCHDGVIKWKHFPCHRWIPCTKASDMELWCFLWSAPE